VSPPDQYASVHAGLLRHQWLALPEALRKVHALRPARLAGRATVERGGGWLAGIAGRLARLPGASSDAPLEVSLAWLETGSTTPRTEIWSRHFGASPPMQSRIRLQPGRLVEQLGGVTLEFHLSVNEGCIQWQPVRGTLWGWLPVPRRWLGGIEARESAPAGRYRFDVSVVLPGIGCVVRYYGELDLIPRESA